MKKLLLMITLLICLSYPFCYSSTPQINASDQALDNNDSYKYFLFLPEDYDKINQQWPMILFLHGAGERGDDLEKVKTHGPPKIAPLTKDFPFIVVSPQCPYGQRWSNDLLIKLLDKIVAQYAVDTERIYLTGLSLGGYGSWSLACEYPHRFAAIAPICGGGEPENAFNLKTVPVWAFHGAKDPVVPVKRTEDMVKAVLLADGNVRMTIYPDAEHDSWTRPYQSKGLYEWFLSHRKTPAQTITPTTPGQHQLVFKGTTASLDIQYLLYLPQGYQQKNQPYPLILFLHGGERGTDLNRVKIHGPLNYAQKNKDFPFIIVSPQCSSNHTWLNELKDLIALLDEVTAQYNVDPDRIYLTGLSMGGFGTWALACEYSDRFAAIIPICGGGQSWSASALKDVPTWAFHGDIDPVVPVTRSQEMITALTRAGGNARLTTYPDVGHNSWVQAYANSKLYEWLLENHKN